MQKLELNGQEVLALSMDIENIKSQLESISKLLNANITYCSNNLVDSESGESVLSTKVEKLKEKNSLCINSLLTNLSTISTFVDSQIKEYSASTEDAENAVNSLINLINEKIDLVTTGSIYESSADILNDSYTKMAKPEEFTDKTGLSAGKVNYEELVLKMLPEDKFAVMDQVHDYLREKGLTEEQTAAICGYFIYTCGYDINAQNPDSSAKGLCQWLEPVWPTDWSLEGQLDHLWEGLQGAPCGGGITSVLDEMNKTTTVEGAEMKFAIYHQGSGVALPDNIAANLGEGVYYYYYTKSLEANS